MEGQDERNTIDLTTEEYADPEVTEQIVRAEQDSETMVLDDMGSISEDSDEDFKAYERGWNRLFGRWQGEGLPGEVTFTGLLDLIEENSRESTQEVVTPSSSFRSVQGNTTRGVDLLPERPRLTRTVRNSPRSFNEGFGPRRLFEN